MSVRLYSLASFFVLLPIFLSAQMEDADIIFHELRVLDGVWFMPQDRGDRLQVWSIENDSTLNGEEMRIKIEDGDTVLLETMRIELRGQVITYHSTIRGQNNNQPIPFEMTLADYEGYLFENPKQVNPQKIRYRLLGKRELQVSTEGQRGNRTVSTESVFEREFTPAGVEFRIRAGANIFKIRSTGNFPSSTDPTISKNPVTEARPGWELGTQFRIQGRGSFISLNVELGLMGKFTHAKSAFTVIDTAVIDYVRDVTYKQTWLTIAAVPEINLKRDGRFTILAGPYYSRLLFNKVSGEEKPQNGNSIYDANNDFKKNDVGIIAGFQYKLNIGKKDLGGTFGLRANLGLADLDALYGRECNDPAFCNGAINLQGLSLYYSFNLLGL